MKCIKNYFFIAFTCLLIFSCIDEECIVDNNQLMQNKDISLKKIGSVPDNNTVFSILYNWRSTSDDHILTLNPGDGVYGTDLGQKAYILYQSTPGIDNNLYRLFKNDDHMASTMEPQGGVYEGGYNFEATLGGLWNSDPNLGRDTLCRYYSSSSGDHDVGFYNEDWVYGLYGYSREGILGYCFKRYGHENALLQTLSNGTVELKANRVAGGSIWELIWDGTQFINHYDYGREIQIALNIGPNSHNNPTEAGDSYTGPYTVEKNRHGSPLISLTTDGYSYLNTTTRPLNWFNYEFLEGTGLDPLTHPIVWDGRIEKEISFLDTEHPQILKWVTKVYLPSTDYFDIEVVTAYLNGDFTRFYVYNGVTDQITPKIVDVSDPSNAIGLEPQNDSGLRLKNGGVIIQHKNEDKALGVYYKTSADLDSREGFTFYNFSESSSSKTSTSFATTKWGLRRTPENVNYYDQTVYLVVGTKNQCETMMRYLNYNYNNLVINSD